MTAADCQLDIGARLLTQQAEFRLIHCRVFLGIRMSRELITLQLGNYANYVGAHYWNFGVSLRSQSTQSPTRACHLACAL